MQADFFPLLCQCMSQERLEAYRRRGVQRHAQVGDVEVCADYLWNTVLCESLYPVLHMVEVTLRNSLNTAIAASYGAQWFESILLGDGPKRVSKAKDQLEKKNHQKKNQAFPVHRRNFVRQICIAFVNNHL